MLPISNEFAANTINDNLFIYTIPAFTATGLVVHGFTTRSGGVSTGSYESLNLGLHVGDEEDAVLKNRRILCSALGIKFEHIVAGQQVHGDNVKIVTKQHLGCGSKSLADALPAVDALITNSAGIPLTSYYADCVPLFFLDPLNKAVGLAHAGWKGTVKKIGSKTVRCMKAKFGSRPEELLVGIGPSIGPCCYAVDSKVIDQVAESFPGSWKELVKDCGGGQWMLNLWEANRRALLDEGVLESNITVAKLCTSCNKEDFFSYRASGGCTGRMASIIMLKKIES